MTEAAPDIVKEVDEDRRYAPYLARQAAEIVAMRRDREVSIPRGRSLGDVPGLSKEMIERLEASDPHTLDQASRLRGITPAAMSALWLHARKST